MIKAISNTVEGFFYAVTGFSLMNSATVFIKQAENILSIDKIASLVVSVFAVFFWISHYFIVRSKNKKEQKILDLEMKIKQKQLENENSDSNRTL